MILNAILALSPDGSVTVLHTGTDGIAARDAFNAAPTSAPAGADVFWLRQHHENVYRRYRAPVLPVPAPAAAESPDVVADQQEAEAAEDPAPAAEPELAAAAA